MVIQQTRIDKGDVEVGPEMGQPDITIEQSCGDVFQHPFLGSNEILGFIQIVE